MSKPDKIHIQIKKGTCYYKRGALQGTGWKSWDKRLLLIGAADKDREGKDREGKKDRRVCSEMSVPCNGRRAVTVQRISQEYGKPALWIVTVPVSVQPCYGVYVSWNSFLVRIISFFRINIPLFEPYHGGTVECQTPPCWLWTCRNSRLKLLFVKSGSSGGVGTMYWQKTVKLSGSCSTVGKTLPLGIHYMHRLKFCYRSASIVISYRGL